jgi:dTDP-4-amino-4,6-dideoxygalactose transaminase
VKSEVADLAIFGGRPAFDQTLHVGAPNIGNRTRLHQLLDNALDRRWLTNDGPYVQAFESRLAELLGVRNCVATCNATSGLMLLAKALGLRGQVIMPSLTFIATPHAVTWQGVEPVFCDVDPHTWTLDAAKAELLVTPETSALLGVHLWGTPCDITGLQGLASRRRLKLVYDAAHALGTSCEGRPVGSFGDAEVFSFHATKLCNSFEGGVIATDDDALATEVALARNFGFADVDRVASLGINAKMPEINAAMGLVSLESFDEFVAANQANRQHYRDGLADVAGVTLHSPQIKNGSSAQQYVVAEVHARSGLRRDELVQLLMAENVAARRYFYPGCHRMEPYRSQNPVAAHALPVTEGIVERTLVLPTGTATSVGAVDRICDLIRFATQQASRIRTRLRSGQQPGSS